MVDTVDGPPPTMAPGMSLGDRVRFVLRGIGQLSVTAGVVVLLFVVYEVYVTNYFAHEAQAKVKTALRQSWLTDHGRDPLLPLPGGAQPSLPEGKGIAYLYIPRLGRDFGWAVVEGTDDSDLEKGPGHYRGTALPGDVGNVGIAGHRVGKGEPFLNLDHLRAGDPVIVQTQSRWFVYIVLGTPGNLGATNVDGVPGREIVSPSDGAVLDDVPDHPGAAPTLAYLTLTTCNPKFTAQNRMVVHATLSRTVSPVGLGMPASIAALYTPAGTS